MKKKKKNKNKNKKKKNPAHKTKKVLAELEVGVRDEK